MKIRLLALTLVLFFTPLIYAETELGLFFVAGQPLHAPTRKMLYGGGLRLFLSNESSYIDIRAAITERTNQYDVEEFAKNCFSIEAETSLQSFTINLTGNFHEEKARLFPFGQPQETVILEKWQLNEVTAGLGLKIGKYNKSYFRFMAFAGYSYHPDRKELRFLDMVLKNKFQDIIIGGNIKSRLKTRSGDFRAVPIWIDFQCGYGYYLQSNKYIVDSTVSLGIRIAKSLAIEGSITAIKRTQDRKVKFIDNRVGLVLLF